MRFQVVCRGVHTSKSALSASTNKVSKELASIIRVDHAGEFGADRIYAGQMAVLGNSKMGPVIREMWEQEKHHKAKFEELIVKYRVRPTALHPFWNVAGFMLGAGSALLGEKAAMACTVAVESVIVEHYNDQLRTLMAEDEPNKEILDTIRKFRDDEQEHHDCGLHHGAQQAPFYTAMTEVIKVGCRAAIAASKGFLTPPAQPSLAFCRNYSTTPRWDLVSAVCIERKPLVTKPFSALELKYSDALAELELANSYKSSHEIRLEEDARRAERLKRSDVVDDSELDVALKQNAQDFEDAGIEELGKFQLAPRTGSSHLSSINRKLESHLVLLAKLRMGDREVWGLPQGVRQGSETMRDTAERVVQEYCGPQLKVSILGNAPFGYFKYKYPSALSANSVGAKIFFFKGLYTSGNVVLNKNLVTDFQWATRSEMGKIIVNVKYLRSIEAFLLDEPEEDERAAKSQ